MRRIALLVVALAAAFAVSAPAAWAKTLVVDNDLADCPKADFTSIQAAVAAAPPRSKIRVCEGVYNEEVVISKDDLSLTAKGSLGDVVLDGQNTMMHGFEIDGASGVLIEGFVVQRYHDDIVLVKANDNVIRRNETMLAWDHDGIELLATSHRNRIEHNIAHDNRMFTSCGISAGGGSSNNVIRHNVVFHNANNGILLGGGLLGSAGPGNVVEHNVVFDNGEPVAGGNRGTGIFNAITPGSVIAHNRVNSNNAHGIFVSGATSTGVTVAHNRVSGNGSTSDDDGIRIQGAPNSVVDHNHSRLNRHDGVHVITASGALVEHNVLKQNGTPGAANGCGIDVDTNSTGTVVRRNVVRSHTRAGIRIRNSAGNLVTHNHANNNPGDGILLTNGDSNVVSQNHSAKNGRDGIRADVDSAGNTIVGNKMHRNTEHDAHDDSVGAGTAGTANSWIDNKCKTENRPGLCEGH